MMTVSPSMAEGETLSFKDKRKFFEQEIAEQKTVKPREGERKFSYLNEHEVEKIRNEEDEGSTTDTDSNPSTPEKKLSLVTHEELRSVQFNHADDKTFDMVMQSLAGKEKQSEDTIDNKPEPAPEVSNQENGNERHVPALPTIRRNTSSLRERNSQPITAEPRTLDDEKKAAWRAARMKSLEEDAMRARAVLERTRAAQRLSEQRRSSEGGVRTMQQPASRPGSDITNENIETTRQQIVELEVDPTRRIAVTAGHRA